MYILLTASDGHTIVANYEIMRINSELIRNLDIDELNQIIPLTNISKYILYKIIKFCNHNINRSHYPTISPSKINSDYSDELIYKSFIKSEWDISFIQEFSYQHAVELSTAASFLGINKLVILSALHMAILLKRDSIDELRSKLDYVAINDDTNDYVVITNTCFDE